MKIRTDDAACIGSENCARYAPNTFGLSTDGTVVVLDPPWDDEATVRSAASSCPVAALEVVA